MQEYQLIDEHVLHIICISPRLLLLSLFECYYFFRNQNISSIEMKYKSAMIFSPLITVDIMLTV